MLRIGWAVLAFGCQKVLTRRQLPPTVPDLRTVCFLLSPPASFEWWAYSRLLRGSESLRRFGVGVNRQLGKDALLRGQRLICQHHWAVLPEDVSDESQLNQLVTRLMGLVS